MNLNIRSKIIKTTKKTIKKKINNKTFETDKKNKTMPSSILRATKYTKCNYCSIASMPFIVMPSSVYECLTFT